MGTKPRNYALDKSAIKALVTLYGPREAARQSGLPVGTVLAWSAKFKWKKASVLPRESVHTGVKAAAGMVNKDAGDLLRESLENSRVNSTLHLAKYTEKASEAAAKHHNPLEVARKVRDVAGVYSTLFPPETEEGLIEGSILIGAAKVTDNVQEIEAHVRQELPDNRPAGD